MLIIGAVDIVVIAIVINMIANPELSNACITTDK